MAFDGVRALFEKAVGTYLEKPLAQLAADAKMGGFTFDADDTAHKLHGRTRAKLNYPAMQSLNHPAAGL